MNRSLLVLAAVLCLAVSIDAMHRFNTTFFLSLILNRIPLHKISKTERPPVKPEQVKHYLETKYGFKPRSSTVNIPLTNTADVKILIHDKLIFRRLNTMLKSPLEPLHKSSPFYSILDLLTCGSLLLNAVG